MADTLVFDPVTEYEVIETIDDFEEAIQRPEELRFFTLDEQLMDYFQKMLPTHKATRFELKQLERERDRIRVAYEKTIRINDTEYVVDTQRKSVNVSWIKPIYGDFDYRPYDWTTEWRPIGEKRKTPNYYPQMLTALPRPYAPTAQDGVPISTTGLMMNGDGMNPIHALGMYVKTKTVLNDDGTTDVITERVRNTQDDVRRIGYHIEARPLELPNALTGHPFLKSAQPSKVITNQELNDIYPNVTSILEHAVPVTQDPYGEGMKYMKLYDIKLSQIPWSAWKVRFPSVVAVNAPPDVVSVTFPKTEKDGTPDEILLKNYAGEWLPGYSPRFWSSRQIDGGEFIGKLFVANANKAGIMPAAAPVEAPEPALPSGDPSVCQALTADFDSFLNAGLYRYGKKDKGGIPEGDGVCVPIGMILKQQYDIIHKGRLPWKETLEVDIRNQHETLLKQFQIPQLESEQQKYAKVEGHAPSERRLNVVSILEDENRTPDDKAEAIEIIVRELELASEKYTDTAGEFVVCSHTLQLLRGDLEEDRLGFYAKWTVSAEGRRVCRFCGEEINKDVIVAQEEYDEDGHLIIMHSALTQNVHHGHDPVQNTLLGMKKFFNLENDGELLLFTYISLLQIVPDENQLMPVIQMIRKITNSLKAAATARKLSKVDQERAEGLIGFAGTVIMFQTHVPFLIPTRTFGNKILKMSGFPRDTDDSEDSPIMNGLIQIVKHIVDKFPTGFKQSIFKAIAGGKIKAEAVRYVKVMATQFKPLLDAAKERYSAEPVLLEHMNDIQVPVIMIPNPFFTPEEVMGKEELAVLCDIPKTSVTWTTKHPPSLSQARLALFPRIYASPSMIEVDRITESVPLQTTPEKDIRQRLKMGVPAGFPVFSEFAKGDQDGVAFVAMATRILDVLSLTDMSQSDIVKFRDLLVDMNTHISSPLFRDVAKGVFFEILHAVKSQKNSTGLVRILLDAAKRDIGMRMILISKKQAEAEDEKLIATERLTLKQRYREKTDSEREITKMLVDIGISEYIITNEDRERFALEMQTIDDSDFAPPDLIPEEGVDAARDYVENGDQPIGIDGNVLEVDYGDYGDRGVRDYNDYGNDNNVDFEEGDGF
jgi:hypothetical protein